MNHKQKIGYTILGACIMLIGMSIDNLTSSPVTAQNDGEITCQKLTFVNDRGVPLFYIETRGFDNELSIFNALNFNWETNVVEPKEVMSLYSSSIHGNQLILLNHEHEDRPAVRLTASQRNNYVTLFNHEGKRAVRLGSNVGTDRNTNSVGIFNNESEMITLRAAMKNAAWHAEFPEYRGRNYESNAIYLYNNTATSVNINDPARSANFNFNDKPPPQFLSAISLVSDEDGNTVSVFNKAPKVIKGDTMQVIEALSVKEAVRLGATEHGGRIDAFNKQGKNRAVMGVTEYGNGAVSTWDKNGYRQ